MADDGYPSGTPLPHCQRRPFQPELHLSVGSHGLPFPITIAKSSAANHSSAVVRCLKDRAQRLLLL